MGGMSEQGVWGWWFEEKESKASGTMATLCVEG